MILIISINNDFTTTYVIRWLKVLKKEFLRINEDDEVFLESITENRFVFKIQNKIVDSRDIKSVWYRRGDLVFHKSKKLSSNEKLDIYNWKENRNISEHLYSILKTKNRINSFNDNKLNKLLVLSYCDQINLRMPPFLITQSKHSLIEFTKKNKEVVSKSITNSFRETQDGKTYLGYSYKLQNKDYDKLPTTFTPTFFQGYVNKRLEIRTFYLKPNFYSMAIFSQNNSKTIIDFRNYDKDNPNRVTPFLLPEFYRIKLNKVLNHFNINSASIDIILSNEDEYFLLDINPIGQFGMTSKPCNYNLEKKIAEFL